MGRFSRSALIACSLAVASASPSFAQANNVFSYKAHISAKLPPPDPKIPTAAYFYYGGTLLSDYNIDLDITGTQIVGASVTSAKRGAATNVTVLPPTSFTPTNTGKPNLMFQMPGVLSGASPGQLATFNFGQDGKGETYLTGQHVTDPAYGKGSTTIALSPEITYSYDTLMFDFDAVDLEEPEDFYKGRIYVKGSKIVGIEGTTGRAGDIIGLVDGYLSGDAGLPTNSFYYDGRVLNKNGFLFDTRSGILVTINSDGPNLFDASSQANNLGIGGDLDFKITYAGIFAPPTGGVPEPATWAMLILGFGVVGSAARRRRRELRAA